MSMDVPLRDGLVFCIHGQRAIFLDVRSSRYFALPDEANKAFIAIASGETPSAPGARALAALKLSSVSSASTAPIDTRSVPRPQTQLQGDAGPVSSTLRRRAIVAQLRSLVRLSCCSLDQILHRLGRRRALLLQSDRARSRGTDLALQVASAFLSTRHVRPRSSHCLTSSLAFLDLALQLGLDAELVFGVQSAPFAAHCWVQRGTELLNDDLEYVSTFTPILAA